MEDALRRRLILLALVPTVFVSALLVAALWLILSGSAFSLWLAANDMEIPLAVVALLVAAAFVVVELAIIKHVARTAGRGIAVLLHTIEAGRVPEREIPRALRDDVEFTVLARRLEQVSRGGRDEPGGSKKGAQLEEELKRIANAIEDVLAGSPFVPLPEKEGVPGKAVCLLNRILPEFGELRRFSMQRVRAMETELKETSEASQSLASSAERSFLESTEALVVAREAGRLAGEAEERIGAVTVKAEDGTAIDSQRKQIRDAVNRMIEAAARGIEELSRGLMKANALSRSSERIANRASVLALNVSVEAARASLPGMNVLAEEIRKLADFTRTSSDESVAVVREIEAKIDSVIRNIHTTQEEVRLKTRVLGLGTSEDEAREREKKLELDRIAGRLSDSIGKLVTRVQEVSRLTEKASREAERVSRKALLTYDRARALAAVDKIKSPSADLESSEIETLSDEDFLIEGPATGQPEGE